MNLDGAPGHLRRPGHARLRRRDKPEPLATATSKLFLDDGDRRALRDGRRARAATCPATSARSWSSTTTATARPTCSSPRSPAPTCCSRTRPRAGMADRRARRAPDDAGDQRPDHGHGRRPDHDADPARGRQLPRRAAARGVFRARRRDGRGRGPIAVGRRRTTTELHDVPADQVLRVARIGWLATLRTVRRGRPLARPRDQPHAHARRESTYPLVLPNIRDPRLHVAAVIITIHALGQLGLGLPASASRRSWPRSSPARSSRWR